MFGRFVTASLHANIVRQSKTEAKAAILILLEDNAKRMVVDSKSGNEATVARKTNEDSGS